MSYVDMINFAADNFSDRPIVSMVCSTSSIPMRYQSTYRKPTAMYHRCNWCGTNTEKTDSRGNCVSCGHPFEAL